MCPAVAHAETVTRYLINPPGLKDARAIGYNHAVIAEGEFYSAGQVAMNEHNEIVGSDIGTQARRVFKNVRTLLGSIGKDMPDIAKVTTHIVDPATTYYDGYKDVYLETFSSPYPAHTVLGADQLAHPEYLVEVEVELPLTTADINAIEPDGETIVAVD